MSKRGDLGGIRWRARKAIYPYRKAILIKAILIVYQDELPAQVDVRLGLKGGDSDALRA
jgi:hypothetical protein